MLVQDIGADPNINYNIMETILNNAINKHNIMPLTTDIIKLSNIFSSLNFKRSSNKRCSVKEILGKMWAGFQIH